MLFSGARWPLMPLHSAMEALGGLCAIVMAIVLFQRLRYQDDRRAEGIAIGFLAMGILEEFHAAAPSGNGFILLRNLASLFGGAGFALVWLPRSRSQRPPWLPWMVAAVSMAVGMAIVAFPASLPEMLRNGEFAPIATAPTSLATLGFLAAALRFVLDYRRDMQPDSLLFAGLALLFGLAELMFTYSLLWDARWWFWHGLRLVAYLLVLGYMVRGYWTMVRDLRAALMERERIAQDLHDGIIQSLFAIGLNLERCQRLVKSDPDEVARQLPVAAGGITGAIRDLRSYIAGLEPQIADGRELEAALAVQMRLLHSSPDLRVSLRIDPAAAKAITPEQATHLLYVAREAMSNSVRHSQARHATVSLDLRGGRLRLAVEDDGVGFPVGTAHGGDGLRNMAARAAKLRAAMTISSEPGEGTRIVFELPHETVHG